MIEQGVYEHLKEQPAVAAMVGSRIYPNQAPQKAPLPYLVYTRDGATRYPSTLGANSLCQAELEILCVGRTYTEAKRLAHQVRVSMPHGFRGKLGDVEVASATLDDDFDRTIPPASGEDIGQPTVIQRWLIWYHESLEPIA